MNQTQVTVVGAGLAGCEAALTLARFGISVSLVEMKPKKRTPAHRSSNFAELVCSNSLKSKRIETASGILKEEMRILGSSVIEAAEKTAVPAGDALAVNRDEFSSYITGKIKENELIHVIEAERKCLGDENEFIIIATGPLTDEELAKDIEAKLGKSTLSFFDAAAPIVAAESVDFEKAFFAARYGRGGADYANCCLNKKEYDVFFEALINAKTMILHEFEEGILNFFSGCQPVEILAKQGYNTLRFGPLKPVGITNLNGLEKPYAVVQLRKENLEGTLFNLVGFQTNLRWNEQIRVFRLIPGLEKAEFERFGVMHRNSFINSPSLLDAFFRCKKRKNLFFVGQLAGVEGYLESAASGIFAGYCVAGLIASKKLKPLPKSTMIGALAAYISDESRSDSFQPMNSNMGILPPLNSKIRNKSERNRALAERAIQDLFVWRKEFEASKFTN